MTDADKAAFEAVWKEHEEYVSSKILSNKAQAFDIWSRALAHRDAQPAGAVNEQLLEAANFLIKRFAGGDYTFSQRLAFDRLSKAIAVAEAAKGDSK